MKAKTKFILIKLLSFVGIPLIMFGTTAIFTALGISEVWGNMFETKIETGFQWLTLILYRFLIYFFPALILSAFIFDKRYKYISRLMIWLNWTLFIYLLLNAIIKVFAIDLLLKISVFNTLDGVVALFGYVFTFIKKKKVDFDSTGAIIGEKI